jgi:probable FeS assembly SUF system protein SufT
MSQVGQRVVFHRDCEVVQIPAGHPLQVAKGTEAVVTQALGGIYTLQLPSHGALVRLPRDAADAVGLDSPAAADAPAPGGELESQVWDALRSCYDPEIPVNIVDLGLVYDLRIGDAPTGGKTVAVKMTLTAQGCGMGTVIAGDAEEKIAALPGVDDARVEIVWDPPWNPRMISAEGRAKLGI